MGFGSGKPNSNDLPMPPKGDSPWLEENEFVDEVALLLNGLAKRCTKCKRAARIKYLDKNQHCPDCREEALSVKKVEKRAAGNLNNYIQKDDGFVCITCGADIMAAKVAHTVRDGLFAFSGSGEVRYEDVPYCPNCEEKPSFHGKPINPR